MSSPQMCDASCSVIVVQGDALPKPVRHLKGVINGDRVQ